MNKLISLSHNNPWPGLQYFTEEQREFFYGREEETEELTTLIKLYSVSILYGESGLGKTSLLKAGIFPKLRENNFYPIYIRIDFSSEIPFMEQIKQILFDEFDKSNIECLPIEENETLWEYFHREKVIFLNHKYEEIYPILVFDQFEEIFTMGFNHPDINSFIIDLADLIENRLPNKLKNKFLQFPNLAEIYNLKLHKIKFVFSFREDFLPHFESLKSQIRDITKSSFRLLPMNGVVAKKAILSAGKQLIDEITAKKIIKIISETKKYIQVEMENYLVVPALLSVYCQGLNNERIRTSKAKISIENVSEQSRENILENFYKNAIIGISGKIEELIEEELIDGLGFRKSYPKVDSLIDYNVSSFDIDELINRRLIHQIERYGAIQIELIHDVLTKTIKENREKRKKNEQIIKNQVLLSSQRKKIGIFIFCIIVLLSLLCYVIFAKNEIEKKSLEINFQNEQLEISNQRILKVQNIIQSYLIPDIKMKLYRSDLKIDDKYIYENTDLIYLILISTTINDDERQYWFNTLPMLSKSKIDELLKNFSDEYLLAQSFLSEKISNEEYNLLVDKLLKFYSKKFTKEEFIVSQKAQSILDFIQKLAIANNNKDNYLQIIEFIKFMLQHINPLDEAVLERSYGILILYNYNIENISECLSYRRKLNKLIAEELTKDIKNKNKFDQYLMSFYNHSFELLVAKNYEESLHVIKMGLSFNTDKYLLPFYKNQAHALLFMGYENEAKKIYKQYINEKIDNNYLFKEAVLEDFYEFEKYKLPKEPMKEIYKLYKENKQ